MIKKKKKKQLLDDDYNKKIKIKWLPASIEKIISDDHSVGRERRERIWWTTTNNKSVQNYTG
jgi:hypothetical protein